MNVTSPPHAGGFLLSPPASSTVSSSATNRDALPHPRRTPLRAGGNKESTFIRHVDQQLLHIQRRFAKRTTPSHATLSDVDREHADAWGDVVGYASMAEACRDVESLVAVIWLSGTPSLQVPYLSNLTLIMANVVQGMPPTPRALFRVLEKLDRAFASLMQGRDVETGERLPGFDGGRGVSGTEKVRIRSLVERMRVLVVEAIKKGEFEYEDSEDDGNAYDDEDKMDTDDDMNAGLVLENPEPGRMAVTDDDEDDDNLDMQIARVFDRTILELGDSLEEPDIGIITEGRR